MARTVDVTPERFTARGEALVSERGLRPLLVWGGIPGERSRVRIDHAGTHQVHGHWLSTDAPSPYRVEPICEHYMGCGGCPLMHLDMAGQARARNQLVRDALFEARLTDVEIGPLVPCPDGRIGFRHVVKVGFGSIDGRIKIGAWGNNREIVPIPNCVVAAPILRKTMQALAHHTIDFGIEPWDTSRRRGVLRSAVLRASRTTGEVLVTLVAGRRDRALDELAEALARSVNAVVGVWLHLNAEEGNAIYQRDEQGVVGVLPLVGKECVEERLNDVVYRIGPGDFFQTNPSVGEVLYTRTLDRLNLSEGDAVIDLYSGVGGIALQAAKRTGFALGVEEVDGAVQRARESARLNKLPAEFVQGRVLEVAPELTKRFAGTGPKVIVNPARRGLEEGVVDAILGFGPSAIAYVSCNPRSMARDLVAFAAKGWRIGMVEPFDMFPHSPHVECVVTLEPPVGAEVPRRRAPKRQLAR